MTTNAKPFASSNLTKIGSFVNSSALDPSQQASQYLSGSYLAWRAADILSAINLTKDSDNYVYGYDSEGDNLTTGVQNANQSNLDSAISVLGLQYLYDIKTGNVVSDYDSTMLYEANARVRQSGIEYISLQDNNTGNNPATATAYWSDLVSTVTALVASTAQVNAGTNDTTFLTPLKFKTKINAIRVATTWVSTTNGYSIFYDYDGTIEKIEQWGYLATSNVNFTFPIAFPTYCSSVEVTNSNSQGSLVDNAFGYPISLTQGFAATKSSTSGNVNSFSVYWSARGK